MKKKLKKLVCSVLLFSVLIGVFKPMKSEAYIKTPDGKYPWTIPITSYSQYHMDGSTSIILPGSDGLNMRTAACGWFSAYFALSKAGIPKEGYDTRNLIEDARNKGAYFGGWLLDYSKLNKIFPDAGIKGINKEDMQGRPAWGGNYGINLSGLSTDEAFRVMKALQDKGYYLVVCLKCSETSGHYVFLDYIPEDKPNDFRIMDSGFPYTYLSDYKDYKNKTMRFAEMWVLDLSNGDSKNFSKNRPSLYKDGVKPTKVEEKTGEDLGKLVDEMDLVGMENYQKDLNKFQVPVYPGLELADAGDKFSAEKIREENQRRKKLNTVSKVLSVLGWLQIGYGLGVIILYYTVGRYNVKVMKLVMFGKYVLDDDMEEQKVANGIKKRKFLIRSISMVICGFIVVSGVFFNLILKIFF